MIALVLLAQLAAVPTPVATPTPAPVVRVDTGQTRTLADVARERKLGKKGVQGGTLSVTGAPVPQSGPPAALKPGATETEKEAHEADARLAKAITDGAWVDRNIHYNEQIRRDARREWDDAAENCRKTPGCVPVYRDSVELGGHKPLLTGDEAKKDRKFAKDSHEIETRLNNADAPNPTPAAK
jgi:hypothetical protein